MPIVGDGYWRPCKSKKGAGDLPVRVRIPWPDTKALTDGVKEPAFREGEMYRWEERNKHGGGMVRLDSGTIVTVQPGQFEVWVERESG